MAFPMTSETRSRLSELSRLPEVLAAGLLDRQTNRLEFVDSSASATADTLAAGVLLEALLTAAAALAAAWRSDSIPHSLRLESDADVVLLHCLDGHRCLVLRHAASAPRARFSLALREAAADLAAMEDAAPGSSDPADGLDAFATADFSAAKSGVYNPFTPA